MPSSCSHSTVTCHNCRKHTDLYTIEWPPKVFVCYECSAIFVFDSLSITDEPIFHLAGFCRFKQ